MATEKEIGIVIKTLNYDDHDLIVTVLTSEELISFIALGVRRLKSKNRVALQLGNTVELELFKARLKGKLSKLKKATLINQIPIKSSDTAMVLLDVIRIIKNIKHPSNRLFKAFLEVSKDWGKDINLVIKTYLLFQFLGSIGTFPILDRCAECGRKDNIAGFEFYLGGFTCNMHTKTPRDLSVLQSLNNINKGWKYFKDVDNKSNFEINKLLEEELRNYYIKL